MPFFNNKVKDIIEIVYESKSVEEIFGRNIWKKYFIKCLTNINIWIQNIYFILH